MRFQMKLYAAPVVTNDGKFLLFNDGTISENFTSIGIDEKEFDNMHAKNRVANLGDDGTIHVRGDGIKSTYVKKKFIDAYTGKGDITNFFKEKWDYNFANDFLNDIKNESSPAENSEDVDEVISSIQNAISRKPKSLIISDLKWKLLVRSILRGKNLMVVGPTGCGKTMASKIAAKLLERELFIFNMGSTQDPRLSLIGNTSFNPADGTVFNKSEFVKAITTPNAVVILDEFTRIHPEGMNILMTVLDPGQRYLRLDESEINETVKVAEGVSFIATANIGNEYTSTRTLDRAIVDRFQIFEMDVLQKEDELKLLNKLYPNQYDDNVKLVEMSDAVKRDYYSENPNFETFISTRVMIETADLIQDGFSFLEALELVIYPYFTTEGGVDSERAKLKQIVQKDQVVTEDTDF